MRSIEEHDPSAGTSLRSVSTRGAIAVVISEPATKVFGHPYFADVVKGISAALAARSMTQVLLMPHSPRTTELDGTYITGGHVDGVILVSLHADSPLPRRLIERGIPAVIQGRPPEGVPLSYIDIDNRRAGALAVTHLLSLGRRRIATITGNLSMPGAVDRLNGYRDGLRAAGATLDPTFEEAGDYQADVAHLAMERLLMRHPDLDGVFAASDLMAGAAVRVLQQAHKRIPEDVAVIGFDDSLLARISQPPLSSVRQPIEQMGRQAVDLLMHHLEQPDMDPTSVILSAELVTRASTMGSGA